MDSDRLSIETRAVGYVAEPDTEVLAPAPSEAMIALPMSGLALPIQRKVTVGSANDPAEVEAEQVAASVVDVLRRRRVTDDGDAHEHGAGCGHDHSLDVTIRRHADHAHGDGDHGPVGLSGGELGAATESRLAAASGGGRPIADGIRGPLESALNADLSGVRLHAGPTARELSRSMSAEAFTQGNNVFFRDGMPDTATDAGLHLLSHELTHTVQQGAAPVRRKAAERAPELDHRPEPNGQFSGAVGGIRRSTAGPTIQRHAAFEHYMLGQLPPRELAKIPAVRDAQDNAGQTKNIANGKGGGLQAQDTSKKKRNEVLHLIDMEMARLWRYKKNPEALNSMAGQMGKVYKGKAQVGEVDTYGSGSDHASHGTRKLKDTEYDVPIVVLTCLDGTIVLSYSEMNTMPDLFGNPEAIEKTPKAKVLSLLQGVRQQLYIELSNLRAELDPVGGSNNKLESRGIDGDFKGATGPRAQAVVEKAYEIRTERDVNVATTRKGQENEQYFSALERNACHFAPESWAQWRGYHEKALEFADAAAVWRDKAATEVDQNKKQQATEYADKLGNQALLQNSFGEHYLQDSFAAGHLVDKTKIMQWFTLWLHNQGHELGSSDAAKAQWAMAIHAAGLNLTSNPQALHDRGVRGDITDATDAAAGMGMQSSPDLKFMVRWRALAKTRSKFAELDVKTAQLEFGLSARQAQVFFDSLVDKRFASKNVFGQKYSLKSAILNNKAYDATIGVAGQGKLSDADAGNSAAEFNLASLKELLSNAYIGASTKFFHDMFCKEGLEVATDGDVDLGRIYGDANMMNAGGGLGLEWSAETSRMSRDAVFDTIRGGAPQHTTAQIEARFPKKVKIPETGTIVPIADFNLHLKAEGEKAGGLFEQAQDWKAKGLYKTLGFSDKGALDLTKLTGAVAKQRTLLDQEPF
ncbi:MAG: hypothetical protein JWO57_3234 [Pseudonocardiales bacterium]|nr:hypothetical protein [Pseudonocardiales bacterium]